MLDVAGEAPHPPAPAGAVDVGAGTLEIGAGGCDRVPRRGRVDEEAAALPRTGIVNRENERRRARCDDGASVR